MARRSQYEKEAIQFTSFYLSDSEVYARVWFQRMLESYDKKHEVLAAIQGMVDGNPPYSDEDLIQAGHGYLTNKNFRDATAVLREIKQSYWAMLSNVKSLVRIGVKPSREFINNKSDLADYERVCSEKYSQALCMWPEFKARMQMSQADLVTYGSSIAFRATEKDWMFDVADQYSVFVPTGAKNNINTWDSCAIAHSYSPSQLWSIYLKIKNKQIKSNWNVDSLQWFLFNNSLFRATKVYSVSAWGEFQDKVKSNRGGFDAWYTGNLQVVSIYSRNQDGKIDHTMIDPRFQTVDFLYKAKDQYEEFDEFCYLFTLLPGEEYYDLNKGIGFEIYDAMEILAQNDSAIVDQSKRSGTLIVSSNNQVNDDSRGIEFTLGGIIDVGMAKVEQNTLGSSIQPAISVAQYFQQKVFNNLTIGGLNANSPEAAKRNIDVLGVFAIKEAAFYKMLHTHYYEQLDRFHAWVFSNFLKTGAAEDGYKYVRQFKDDLELELGDDKLVKQLLTSPKKNLQGLPFHLTIEATKIAGSGSQSADLLIFKQQAPYLGTMKEHGKQNFVKDFFTVTSGTNATNRYFPAEDDNPEPDDTDSTIDKENDMMEHRMKFRVGYNQNHIKHAAGHLERMKGAVQAFESGQYGDPSKEGDEDEDPILALDNFLAIAAPHTVEHIVQAEGNPLYAGEVKQLKMLWGELVNYGRKIEKAAKSHREALARKQQQNMQAETKAAGDNKVALQKLADKNTQELIKIQNRKKQDAERIGIQYLLGRAKIATEADIELRKDAFAALLPKKAPTPNKPGDSSEAN